jgi:hypothetical protein
MGIGLRVMAYNIKMLHKVLLQLCVVSLAVHIRTEVDLYLVAIAVNFITVPVYHIA